MNDAARAVAEALGAVLELHAPQMEDRVWARTHPDIPGCSECRDEGWPQQLPCATVKVATDKIREWGIGP